MHQFMDSKNLLFLFWNILKQESICKYKGWWLHRKEMQSQDMDLALSTDAKPRLKWTPVLHQRFIEAVTQLGGEERATPKSLMRVMGIPGLTLYHLKSHLQKYRLGKNQQSETCNENDQEDSIESEFEGGHTSGKDMDETHVQMDESLHIAQTLQMQMEVQNKLHEQIEVQRHLQLRIEAQGIYLQSILKKAQETLAGYNSSVTGREAAKTEVTELESLVETNCFGSSFAELTNTGYFVGKRVTGAVDCSVDSSLTYSESCGREMVRYPSLEVNRSRTEHCNVGWSHRHTGRKRRGSPISDESCVEQPVTKIPPTHQEKPFKLQKLGLSEELDLNCKNGVETVTVRPQLDLNSAGTELFDECSEQLDA